MTHATTTQPATIAIVGGGPRGVGLLERIAANLPELLPDQPVEIHLVDPYPPGPGRVWRHDQSPLLWMNSMAKDVTMFTDHSVRCDGPIRPGPSLAEWAKQMDHASTRRFDTEFVAELRALTGATFPTRRMQSAYLAWFFDHTVAEAPSTMYVQVHAAKALRVTGSSSEQQLVWLAGRHAPLLADVVVLALGHLDAEPSTEHERLRHFAEANGLYYLPPAYTTDVDLSAIQPGQDVIVRGFGLAFIDLMVLLTQGRGGKYRTEADGRLTYQPSGREPTLYVGSRRGVPYHSKTSVQLRGNRPALPRFLTPEMVRTLVAGSEKLNFWRDVWPVLAKEIAWGYYHELFTGHPHRTRLSWAEFADRYQRLRWDSTEIHELIEDAVPAAVDRIDFEALDRPLRGLTFERFEDLQDHLRAYIEVDIARRSDPAHSAELGAFLALLSSYGQLLTIRASGRLTPRSQTEDLDGWWQGFFNQLASGPPGPRLRQLVALSEAGIVRFLGAQMWVSADDEHDLFVAGSASTTHVVRTTALVESYLPTPTVRRSTNELLRSLYDLGEGVEEVLVDDRETFEHNTGRLLVSQHECRMLDGNGNPHPRRFAIGVHTTGDAAAGFARPGINAGVFRQNDGVARTILGQLSNGRTDRMRVSREITPPAQRVPVNFSAG